MSSDKDMSQMYQSGVKPKFPDMQGLQYADSPPGAFGGSSDNNHLSVTYNQDCTEIASDRPTHQNTTAEEGSFHWDGQQYGDDFGAGESKSYGTMVSDNGQSPKVERTTVDISRADRGKES